MIYPILGCAESFKINDLLQAKGLNDNFESSSSEVFCNKASPENLAKATGKLICRCLFFNEAAGYRRKFPEQLFI